jgi:hypothetical protein
MGGVQALVITGVPTLTPLISMPSLYRRQFNSREVRQADAVAELEASDMLVSMEDIFST